jgi:hypothetical protein
MKATTTSTPTRLLQYCSALPILVFNLGFLQLASMALLCTTAGTTARQ